MTGELSAVIERLKTVVTAHPDNAEAHFDLARCLTAAAQPDAAAHHLQHAIRLEPEFPDAYLVLAILHRSAGRLDQAVQLCRVALAKDSDCGQAHQELSSLLAHADDLPQAEHHMREAMRCYDEERLPNPTRAKVRTDLAGLLVAQRRMREAAALYESALSLAPDDAEIHAKFGVLLLTIGQFRRGWAEYEYRWKRPGTEDIPSRLSVLGTPQWDGSPLAGRTILLYGEQGLGDTIQAARYVPLMAARGVRVVMQCPAELIELFKSLAGVTALGPDARALPPFDVHAALMSVPGLFGTDRIEAIPGNVPYLKADPGRVNGWRNKLAGTPRKFRVGLVWTGNPAQANNALRSIPLGAFAAFKSLLDRVEFHSLQKGEATQLIPTAPIPLIDHSADLHDLADTAALMENLDLIISACTSPAHLAGALGRPVWTLLRYVPDWRWLEDREDSPWYPTMRLFRQPRAGDWPAVLDRVAGELQRRV